MEMWHLPQCVRAQEAAPLSQRMILGWVSCLQWYVFWKKMRYEQKINKSNMFGPFFKEQILFLFTNIVCWSFHVATVYHCSEPLKWCDWIRPCTSSIRTSDLQIHAVGPQQTSTMVSLPVMLSMCGNSCRIRKKNRTSWNKPILLGCFIPMYMVSLRYRQNCGKDM